ncbi:XRE family transcriptional regulator [Photobacterium frigidiphilum]|uniref:XRE family transcriptional regulator n=1 Tax=Photobacterium frigidiphilum TaxID=264736 RepID=A0A2T3J6V5_9GAMM|nr:helix-turn-helix domain-containing protein [Photobacterium frigidiphilum]PSU44270.1 XRE family transcriptional regulator [Photobacterium frigidiphilum]
MRIEKLIELKNYRYKNSLTQLELGEILDMEQGTISNLENGRRRLDATKVKRVSELTGISKHELRPDLYEEGQ